MAAKDNLHPQLFDTKPYERELTPEEKGPASWMAHHAIKGDLQFHGTFRDDWRNAPAIHSGTMGQAVERLDRVSNMLQHMPVQARTYYDPSSGDDDYGDESDDEPIHHEGRVYAFRMSGGVHPTVLGDQEANDADVLHQLHEGVEPWEIPRSVKGSLSDVGHTYLKKAEYGKELPHTEASMALEEGTSLPYHNIVEANNPIDPHDSPATKVSHLTPGSSVTTWEHDVAVNPHASQLAKNYAQQRITNRTAGSVAFPSMAVGNDASVQGTLFQGYGSPGQVTHQATRPTINDIQFKTSP